MSDSNAQEPTMEEILASIRRIISEDDAPAAEEAAPAAAAPVEVAAPEPVPEPMAAFEDDDVLELTEAVAPPEPVAPAAPAAPPIFPGSLASSQVMGDLDISFPPGPQAAPPRPVVPAFTPPNATAGFGAAPSFAPAAYDEGLVSAPTLDKAASFFGALGRNVQMPAEGRTLEDVVSELLRPLLKDWLDTHLASIVEAKVQAEVERVSGRR